MTIGANSPRDPEDLLIRARRAGLSEADQRAFEQALRLSAHLRIAYQVGLDFDEQLQVRLGDHELIARASERVLLRPRRARGRLSITLVAAAALLSAGAASGIWGWGKQRMTQRSSAHSGEPAQTRPWSAPTPSAPPTATPSSSAVASVASTRLLAAHRAPLLSAAPASSAPLAEDTAASLFAAATSARRAGDIGHARRLFSELQSSFPRSNEAQVSRVSLGKLLSEAGAWREAERQFADYLALGAGPLREEALVGRADALARLGAAGDERRVWQELLRSNPAGLYAARAKQRLLALSASDGSSSE